MYGVVLWSDAQDKKAVIWCEDHGDLAYLKQTDEDLGVPLDAGDWVQFDMTMESRMRFAHNPRLVDEAGSPGIANALCAVTPAKAQPRESAEIIPFSALREAREEKVAEPALQQA